MTIYFECFLLIRVISVKKGCISKLHKYSIIILKYRRVN